MNRRINYTAFILTLLACPMADAQQLARPLFAPTQAICEEVWEKNVKTAEDIRKSEDECRSRCVNQVVASDFRVKDKICGGPIPSLDENSLAMYEACRPIDRSLRKFSIDMKEINTNCEAGARNAEAVKTVWNASETSDGVPENLRRPKEEVERLNSKVSTGNTLVDKYRNESQRRASNAAANIHDTKVRELENMIHPEDGDGNVPSRTGLQKCQSISNLTKRHECREREMNGR